VLSRNFPCCHQTSTEQKKAKTYGFASFRALSCVSKRNIMVKMVADPDPLSRVLHHPSQRAIPDCKRGDPSNAGHAVLHSHITYTFKLEGEKRSLRINSPPVGCEMVPLFFTTNCWNRFAPVSSSIKNSACFCYWINRKDMSCHESKISFFEYVR